MNFSKQFSAILLDFCFRSLLSISSISLTGQFDDFSKLIFGEVL